WHRIIRSASTLILILFPFFPITFLQSMWSLVYTPNKPLAPALALKKSPRVLWLLFDEMDQRLAFSKRPPTLSLPEFDRLRGQSLYPPTASPPADSTPVSMPAMLTGKLLSKTELVNQSKLMITIADSDKTISWSSQPNLFSQAREAGFNTTLIGWYIPYCSL